MNYPIGLALYARKKQKNGRLFVFEVFYEYANDMFVGFRKPDDKYYGNVYEIKKVGENDYKYIYWDISDEKRNDFPVGIKYTQLEGGGGGYKATRKIRSMDALMKNPTTQGIIKRFFESDVVRKFVKEQVSAILK